MCGWQHQRAALCTVHSTNQLCHFIASLGMPVLVVVELSHVTRARNASLSPALERCKDDLHLDSTLLLLRSHFYLSAVQPLTLVMTWMREHVLPSLRLVS